MSRRAWIVAGVAVLCSTSWAQERERPRATLAVGDFDGDGKPDVAVGLPRSDVGTLKHAGVVRIYSCATGSFVSQTSGESADEWYGASIAAVGDVDEDGATDLAIGHPQHVDIVSGRTGKRIRRVMGEGAWDRGPQRLCAFGDGSGRPRVDLAVRCWDKPCWRIVHSDTGAVDGFVGINWQGNLPTATSVGDVDGDGHPDLALANWDARVEDKPSAGVVRIVSGKRFREGRKDSDILVLHGSRIRECFGMAIAAAGDWDGDGKCDVLAGEPGDQAKKDPSWLVRVFSGKDGTPIWNASGSAGELSMSSIELMGDADGDGRSDVAVGRMTDDAAGGITAFSSKNGAAIWSIDGAADEQLGDGLWPCGDADGDGVADLVVLAPGASRSGGSVRILSGKTGRVIRRIDPFATRSDGEIVKDATAPKGERREAARRLVEARGDGLDAEPVFAVVEEWLRDASVERAEIIELVDRLWRDGKLPPKWADRLKSALMDVAKRPADAAVAESEAVLDARYAALVTLQSGVGDAAVVKLLWSVAKDEADETGPRIAAVRGLSEGGVNGVETVPDWTVVTKSKDEDVRQAVADNLSRAKPPEFDAVLGPLQFDANARARSSAVDAQTRRRRPTMLARFDELMEDVDDFVRFMAMLAAGTFKDVADGHAQRAAIILRLLESSENPNDVTGALLSMTMLAGETFGVKPTDIHVREQDVDERARAAFIADKPARKAAADAWRAKFGADCAWTDADRAKTLTKLLASADPANVTRAKAELALIEKPK